MTPIGKNGSYILWGTVTRDAKLRQTNSGKNVTSFGMKYDRHHNEDGQKVNEYMEVSVWDDAAVYVGDPDIGIAKGDSVFVCGTLQEDTYRKEGEDPNIKKWRINAEIVIDMTSIFQVAQMVVNGEAPASAEIPPSAPSGFSETKEKTPFQEAVDEESGELPF